MVGGAISRSTKLRNLCFSRLLSPLIHKPLLVHSSSSSLLIPTALPFPFLDHEERLCHLLHSRDPSFSSSCSRELPCLKLARSNLLTLLRNLSNRLHRPARSPSAILRLCAPAARPCPQVTLHALAPALPVTRLPLKLRRAEAPRPPPAAQQQPQPRRALASRALMSLLELCLVP